MKIPRIFYDPDNPYSRFVWGVEPGHEGRRGNSSKALLILVLAVALPHAVFSPAVPQYAFHFISVGYYTPLAVASALGWILLTGVVFLRLLLSRAPTILLSTTWRDMRLAGISGGRILSGRTGGFLYALSLTLILQTIISITLICLHEGAEPDLHCVSMPSPEQIGRMKRDFGLLILSFALAFSVLSTVLLDIALWVVAEGRFVRVATWAAFLMLSPMFCRFFNDLLAGQLSLFRPPLIPALLEILSWPVRGWIVWRVWRSAIRTLDEDDVP